MKYINRGLEKQLERYIKVREIMAVVGTRQCGKTTLINHFLDRLEKTGKKIERISFDNMKVLQLFEEDIDTFIDRYVKGNDLLFIDEVHYSKDSGKKLKYIYDLNYIKIIISGSSAAEISINSLKYLVGRIFTFTLYPLMFKEFLSYKNPKLVNIFEKSKYKGTVIKELNVYLEEFLLYGGYPRVVLTEKIEEKKKVLESIYSTYLLKEIKEIFDLSEDYQLNNLLKILSLQIGNIINYNEISKSTGFSYNDLRKYLNILEKTYICCLIKPFYINKRTEIVKSPKVYFIDSGFRNVCIDNFTKERSDKGQLYENFIYSELLKKGIVAKYWNTKSYAEVDFIIEKDNRQIPIEIKSSLKEKKLTKSYISFIEKYKPKEGYYLSLDFEGIKKVKNSKIIFLPFLKFVNLYK
ncbi:conserved hypothetical protein [sediment metagenome]|uniref:AAA+ ATPase domain-containing protein n=1 Tax=sediment metagenome TaxID=749907 RepID=D9PJB9_9ZZZZ